MKRAAFLLLVSCGTRTPLLEDDVTDASTKDVVIDVVVRDAACSTDDQCEDGYACTLDRCDPALHLCSRAAVDLMCDDGIFCNGDEHCDLVLGCTKGARACADTISCTVDTCDESAKACFHKPDDNLCPISHACDPVLGCQARAFAHDSGTLYDVRLPSGQVKVIGSTGLSLTDIALHPSNVLYGIAAGQLFIVDKSGGAATLSKTMSVGTGVNAADVAPSGVLYIGSGSSLYTLDTSTGQTALIMAYPTGRSSSGDLAFIGGRLLATANGSVGDDVVELDITNKTSKVLGSVGYGCVWGLAAFGSTLYGLTCEGRILSINTTTGKGTELNKVSTLFWGASAR